jgi:glycosyltransferase involved in cell wall biosynthesis
VTESRLHIAIDARELCGHPTGVGRYLANLLAEWTRAAMPHRFTLYATETIAWPDAGGAAGGVSRPAVDIRVLPGKPGSWWEQVQLPAALAADHPDVLFAPAYTAPLRTKIPTVLTIHDLSFVAHPEWFTWREGPRRRWITRQAARRAAAVVAVSEFSRQEILTRLGLPASRVHAIHSGLPRVVEADSTAMDAGQRAMGGEQWAMGGGQWAMGDGQRAGSRAQWSEPRFGAEPRANMVLYAGSIFNRRHVPDLVRAFAQVVARRASARLVLVGDNRTHPHESIEALVETLGLSGRVELRAYVSDADLAALYRQARVFAFLSEYEGFGFTPLEALQAGVPILVADTPVSREIYGEAATYVRVGDVPACADALLRLLEDDEARGRVLAEAPAVLARYSWERAARETMAVIEHVA